MASDASRPKRANAGQKRTRTIDELVDGIFEKIDKPRKPVAKKKQTRKPRSPEPSSPSEAELEPAQGIADVGVPRAPKKRVVDLDTVKYTMNCTTFFDEEKVWMDADTYYLKNGFKAQEYTAKSIVAVNKRAERAHVDAEFGSCVVTIGGTKLKQLSKCLEDPTDWNSVTRMIETFAKEGIQNIRIEYVLKYEKKKKSRKIQTIDQIKDNEELDELDEHGDPDSPLAHKTKKVNVS